MKISRPVFALAFLFAPTLIAQDTQVTPLMSKDLADHPGMEGLMISVVYPPGASDPIHRHNAHAFVYVLEGTIVMQVKGEQSHAHTGPEFLRRAERCSYRRPQREHHKTAKFVVFLLKDKGAPVLVPVNPPSASVFASPKSHTAEK